MSIKFRCGCLSGCRGFPHRHGEKVENALEFGHEKAEVVVVFFVYLAHPQFKFCSSNMITHEGMDGTLVTSCGSTAVERLLNSTMYEYGYP